MFVQAAVDIRIGIAYGKFVYCLRFVYGEGGVAGIGRVVHLALHAVYQRLVIQIDVELDLDNIKIEDDELMQKQVVRMLLKEKGFNSAQIEKKINKYVDAGLLEDEAEDAIEDLKEIREEKKKELLEN